MPVPPMQLLAFRVTNFRSVEDSGWVETDKITSLIGTNESGKTNLLVPLWKLNPAKEGDIKLIADAPRKHYNNYRRMDRKPVFISARFALSAELGDKISKITGVAPQLVTNVEVTRSLGGNYTVAFPDAPAAPSLSSSEVRRTISDARTDITSLTPLDAADGAFRTSAVAVLDSLSQEIDANADLNAATVTKLSAAIGQVAASSAPAGSEIAARIKKVVPAFAGYGERLRAPGATGNAEARDLVQASLPSFVYYTTYGNLDSEIYLPHVIDDLKRKDLSGRAEARARTLRVLFDFVGLQPLEILELGKDFNEAAGKPNEDQIKAFADKKKERSVLLQSASTLLTTKFRDWWKQGEYRFRFEADGNHFRIWVSDDKRPEEIELEGRSTGLQWFLSFYLIFLVESRAAHNGSILLLDEPGHSLHPIAQFDLAQFFESLAESNQLLFTTHSPFLVDPDHLDRVRAVYVDHNGHTAVSTDLRSGQAAAQSKSIYPVHAALGLSVSETLFQGCRLVIVEGQSDQVYLSAIKILLIAKGRLRPMRDLLFVPTSGAKAIKTVASILSGRDGELPLVLCDGDDAGETLANSLRQEMYKDAPSRILLMTDFCATPLAEIEDFFPTPFMVALLDRYLKGPTESPFEADGHAPIVPQVKAYCRVHGLTLAKGWKVDVAKLVKPRLSGAASGGEWDTVMASWQKLFDRLTKEEPDSSETGKETGSE
jgi:predicted ATPase